MNDAERANIRNFLSLSKLDPNEPPGEGMFAYYLEKAKKEAATALEPFGYYNARIEVTGESTADGFTARIDVVPGEPARISAVDLALAGEGAEEPDLLKAKARVEEQKGEIFNHSIYEQNKSSLLELAADLGYPRARYETSRVEVRRSENRADIIMRLDTDILHTVAGLDFDSEVLDHELLRKISPVQAGDVFSAHALTAMRQTMYDSGYFSTVDVSYDLNDAEEGRVPVAVHTTPAKRHRYGFGIGYGTDTGARGTIDYSNRYLNKRGHQLDLRLRPAQRLSSFSGLYSIPVGDPNKDKLTISTNYQTESFENIDTTTWLSKISREHNWKHGHISAYLQYLDEHYDMGDRKGYASMLIPGLSASLIFADNRVNTKHGFTLWASVEGAEDGLLASTSFMQVKAGGKAIVTPLENWRVIGRGQIGVSMADDLNDLPPTLRFFAGGDQSVRGYGYKRIAPRHEEDNDLIGGRHMMSWSVELERMLFGGLALAAFYDSAAVMNDFDKYAVISGAGVGLHWNAPFGQLRIDLGVPVDDIEYKNIRLHFTLGTDL